MSDAQSSRPPASSAPVEEEEEESLEKLQAEIAKMEEEAARIAEETANLERQKAAKMASSTTSSSNTTGTAGQSNASQSHAAASGTANATPGSATASKDACSIYVGQVDYSATPEELLAHFEACGTVERVTIVCDKFTGQPKGYAYLEFQSESAVENAVKLDGSTFKGRTLKVTSKRVNDPNFYYNQAVAPAAGGRGRGFHGRGRGPPMHGRGGYGAPPMMGAPPFRGGRGRAPYRGGFRGGFGGGYHPYY